MAWHGMASDFVFANRLDEATTTLLHSMLARPAARCHSLHAAQGDRARGHRIAGQGHEQRDDKDRGSLGS